MLREAPRRMGDSVSFERTVQRIMGLIEEPAEGRRLRPLIEEEMRRVMRGCEEIERLRANLNTKIEAVEQMEIDNLENHLLLEQRLRSLDQRSDFIGSSGPMSSGRFRGRSSMSRLLSPAGVCSQETQTDLSWKSVADKERQLEVKESEVEIGKFRSR